MAYLTLDPQQIAICLARKRMTRSELCRLAGITEANISTMLKKRRVRPKTAGLIADALGVDVEEILVLPAETET